MSFFPDLLYHAPESSTSTEPSPINERKSFPRKGSEVSKILRGVSGSIRSNISSMTKETSMTFPKKRNHQSSGDKSSDDSRYGFTRKIHPPSGFSDNQSREFSEAECDINPSKQNEITSENKMVGFREPSGAQFSTYGSPKQINKDYSIKV